MYASSANIFLFYTLASSGGGSSLLSQSNPVSNSAYKARRKLARASQGILGEECLGSCLYYCGREVLYASTVTRQVSSSLS